MEEVFGRKGSLSRMLPGYEFRLQQLEMSRLVERGLRGGGHVLAEAGTGTGKTLAYLVPAVLSGLKVVVSTGTKALQEQLFDKEIPLIRKVLSKRFLVAVMKGRPNYLCRNRFQQFRSFPLLEDPGDADRFRELCAWVGRTQSGDVAELSGMTEQSPLWKQVNSTPETCLGGKCPDQEDCFITAMRRRAARSDLLIVNHHLFFSDLVVREQGLGEVIPDYDAVIFDEAHMIEEVATLHFGFQVSNYRFEELVRDTAHVLKTLKKVKGKKIIEETLMGIERGNENFFAYFRSGPGRARIDYGKMRGRFRSCGEELVRLLGELDLLFVEAESGDETFTALSRRTREISEVFRRILTGEQPDLLHWYEVRGKGVFLHASPVDVSGELNRRLFSNVFCVILTSATLTTGGDFRFMKQRLGIEEAEEKSFPSPFDPARQSLIYLPKIQSDPNGPAFDEEAAFEIERILGKTRGRAFVLFTSNRHLDAVYGLLVDRIRYLILKQGEQSREELLARFREDTHSVLFATRSFWQGIDVRGEALSCVIIDKLPFASPSEPIVAARIDAIRKRGGNPFYEYQLPEAAITLKQGFGRLLRSRTDRGVLSILDRRITSRTYGRFFLKTLPDSPVTSDLRDLERILSGNGEDPSHNKGP